MNITAKEKQQIIIDLEKELIKIFTNKTEFEISDEYDLLQLFRVTTYLTFIKAIKI